MSYPRRRQRLLDQFVLSRRSILFRVAPERYVLLHWTPNMLSALIFTGNPAWGNVAFHKAYIFSEYPDLARIFDGGGWDIEEVQKIVNIFRIK
jgi:hypothetical protein